MKICKAYELEGRVQGVGFRPFVFILAQKYNLAGIVFNRSSGVYIEAEGDDESFLGFEYELEHNTPPLAHVESINIAKITLRNFSDFQILKSQNLTSKTTFISPDMSLCIECQNELNDEKNRRFGYPLMNCTNCGPRYSIMTDIPYDRVNTSMNKFEMCEECKSEYEDPANRRYHAQPVSCPRCGPIVTFYDNNGFSSSQNPLEKLANAIKNNKITALKGMGGFHIICDATNERMVELLRKRKNRPSKPFAVLFETISMIKEFCEVSEIEEKALLLQERPIVLVKKKKDFELPENIAPNTNRLGVFLPYTPLHVLLFKYIKKPLIATSANISSEPIITTKEELQKRLGGVVEAFVDFDRDIINFSDDSVMQFADNKAIVLRLSRGFMPKSFKTEYKIDKNILALGAHQKSTIALFCGSNIIISPYIADLDNVKSVEAYEKTIEAFKRFYDFEPDILVCDKHPDYASTLFAKKQNLPTISVQHHYAHILSVMFEKNLNEEVLGISWDGTGLGDDNAIWGGEFFVCDMKNYQRVCTFAPFKLIGGDKSVKNIDRIAFSILCQHKENEKVSKFLNSIEKRLLLEQSLEKNLNVFKCHSVGRLFDAAAAVILGMKNVTYEGESGLAIENLYDENVNESYEIILNGKNEIEYSCWFVEMLRDVPQVAASKFINTLVEVLVKITKLHNKKAVLSGGVFQNQTLVSRIMRRFQEENLEFYLPNELSPNDSSLSLGQILYALYHT